VGALVQQVGEVLDRGHALFGGASAGGGATPDAGWSLAGAGERLRSTSQPMARLTGELPAHHTTFTGEAVQALDAATGTDVRLGDRVRDAGRADASGWASSRAVTEGAACDTAAWSRYRAPRRASAR
jgi:hypothetical protein